MLTVEDTAAAFEVVGSAGEAILEVAGAAPKDRADGAEALVGEAGESAALAALVMERGSEVAWAGKIPRRAGCRSQAPSK